MMRVLESWLSRDGRQRLAFDLKPLHSQGSNMCFNGRVLLK
jgi:hypothetical protein